MSKRVTCRFHCTLCEGHYSSLAAFDAHKRGVGSVSCLAAPAVPGSGRNAWQGRGGVCSLTSGKIGETVTAHVWGGVGEYPVGAHAAS